MPVNLKGRSLLTLKDFTAEEIKYLLNLAFDLKAKKRAGIRQELLKGKNIVLIFDKTSTRTRTAFEVAAYDEGAHVTFLTNSQMGKKESIEDTAKVLGRMYDGIEYRGYKQEVVEALAKYSGVPVWNGLTDEAHPTQGLADVMTMMEFIHKPLNQMKLVFVGDTRNNVANTLMRISSKLGIHYVAVGPEQLKPSDEIMNEALENAKESGAIIEYTPDLDGVKGADAIYTDVWVSMGEEDKMPERVELLTPYRVDMDLIKRTENPNVIFLHCLPSFHDFETTVAKEAKERGLDIREVTDEVFRSKHSKVFDQAENRMHTIKAVMVATL
ncbi:ornithine carbamoyltransferase [Thermosipho africanus H17ap60334]|jgi:ornithine carbamoyltransferase|uniref:Ornithine carbamoyltransferase n=1 Tax=Thermosipho africanus (strain TCF52B) TaxID=484019 RepID=B7IHJ4_THEAB|nr:MULTISPECIES: ornithine carbamoyltransferase [Thermosipho]HCF38041.1 ornithine carbamoyltransferase [Thermosipho africanus]ACJ75558.1 ornithine carbamoyltransferase [Thermosipho africanus TCF52B]EKF49919.1 ornithine carbamoyltransferase [Thermosipho africanus H17ap60334]MBZ4650835.1 argF [Thermosipho sp. (in: thermotogales)]MDK2900970.1 ornithine carbamoyltransferase [Thermosipho sp. (in: thermotogales)]